MPALGGHVPFLEHVEILPVWKAVTNPYGGALLSTLLTLNFCVCLMVALHLCKATQHRGLRSPEIIKVSQECHYRPVAHRAASPAWWATESPVRGGP